MRNRVLAFVLAAGVALIVAAPSPSEAGHGRSYRGSSYGRTYGRSYGRSYYRPYVRPHVSFAYRSYVPYASYGYPPLGYYDGDPYYSDFFLSNPYLPGASYL